MVCFSSLLESEPFVFLVGPNRKRLTIHAGLVKGLSEPLDTLINDRSWKESNDQAATLKDIDVEIFGQFAEYCYTNNYRLIVEEVAEDGSLVESADEAEETSKKTDRVLYCKCSGEREYYSTGDQRFCYACKLLSNPDTRPRPASKLWDEFVNQNFGSIDLSHDELRAHLDNMRPKDGVTTKVVQHAKLYVFADQYLVQPLKDLCIHKLHRDLLAYDIEQDGVEEITALLTYVYDNTSSTQVETGAGWALRDLVMTYAVCKAELLVEDPSFRIMMENGTELASDFARYIVKRLKRARETWRNVSGRGRRSLASS